jgi:succinate dehydrogenase/fumarate reductase cytochrome b subunit (b558 family)
LRSDPHGLLSAGRRDSIHFNHPVNESTHLGRYSLSYLLGHLDLDDLPNHAPRSFHKREFVRQAAFKQHADAKLLWVVRAVLLICVALHITAAFQLSRMSWAARPVGYEVKRNIETTFAASMMRWGGILLVGFSIFHLLHLTAGAVGFRAGQFRHLAVYQNVTAAFAVWPVALFYKWGHFTPPVW